jgi:hypothetical protein
MVCAVHPTFNLAGFVSHVYQGYDQLELMARGRKIALAFKVFLSDDFK